ncbi:unnamed protein product [Chilo suppressalis]|uniref:Histone-lysine N-methyltransferase SETMAR n=1 Tax=Chilo suppressalis TaxID=168631 RepID=A0ABN8B132_CHISP|nr:unnamed protein product [Chilo suppressalis]
MITLDLVRSSVIMMKMCASLATQQKLRELDWEVLMHPPYSPDLAPFDFHLFWSLQNSLGSVRLTSREDWQNHLTRFFDQKPQNIYSNGIMSLHPKKLSNKMHLHTLVQCK